MSALTHSVSRETKFAFVSIDFTTEYCPTGGLELVKVTAPDNFKNCFCVLILENFNLKKCNVLKIIITYLLSTLKCTKRV